MASKVSFNVWRSRFIHLFRLLSFYGFCESGACSTGSPAPCTGPTAQQELSAHSENEEAAFPLPFILKIHHLVGLDLSLLAAQFSSHDSHSGDGRLPSWGHDTPGTGDLHGERARWAPATGPHSPPPWTARPCSGPAVWVPPGKPQGQGG